MRFNLSSFRMLTAVALAMTLGATPARAAHFETDSYARIYDTVRDQERLHGAANVLVAFDIDNTLLASRQALGSDQWFDWQQSLIESHRPNAVAADIRGL